MEKWNRWEGWKATMGLDPCGSGDSAPLPGVPQHLVTPSGATRAALRGPETRGVRLTAMDGLSVGFTSAHFQ
jgi:hypothetical protein